MTRKFSRDLIMCSIDIEGYYRFQDKFQIFGLDDTHPKPTSGVGDFPLIIEYWTDIDEEEKKKHIEDMHVSAHESVKDMLDEISYFQSACDEIMILLSLFTTSIFFKYNWKMQECAWFTPFGQSGTYWGQKLYSPGKLDFSDVESFSEPDFPMIPQVNSEDYSKKYYRQIVRYPGQNTGGQSYCMPDSIDSLFSNYYRLDSEARIAFLRAATFFYQACNIWFKSRSLSYTALISSIEALIYYEYMGVKYKTCGKCNLIQYRVMKKFRTFFKVEEKKGSWERKYINMLYTKRSNLLHNGFLFEGDLSTPGYYSENESEENAILRNLLRIIRQRIIRWLANFNFDIEE